MMRGGALGAAICGDGSGALGVGVGELDALGAGVCAAVGVIEGAAVGLGAVFALGDDFGCAKMVGIAPGFSDVTGSGVAIAVEGEGREAGVRQAHAASAHTAKKAGIKRRGIALPFALASSIHYSCMRMLR